jgi:hypothetical protein
MIVEQMQQDTIDGHKQAVAEVKALIRDGLLRAGHTADEEIKIVNGHYVGLFVLPSGDYVHIGLGMVGGRSAYRGKRCEAPIDKIVGMIVEHAASGK